MVNKEQEPEIVVDRTAPPRTIYSPQYTKTNHNRQYVGKLNHLYQKTVSQQPPTVVSTM